MLIKLRRKYTTPATGKGGAYRTRTGPMCCNANCPSTRKKSKRVVKREAQRA